MSRPFTRATPVGEGFAATGIGYPAMCQENHLSGRLADLVWDGPGRLCRTGAVLRLGQAWLWQAMEVAVRIDNTCPLAARPD
jgi:hypothetical protein